MKPFFSIGVTSYKRYELLRECLTSILQQEVLDVEIIVGNDYPKQKISAEFIGIDDPRIKYVNNSRNLGPIHNANALLKMAQGRYFTWLADDDRYFSDFLKNVHTSLKAYDYPRCIFTSYLQGETYPEVTETFEVKPELYKGSEFLKQYLLRAIKTIGCYGVFDLEYLRSIGGMEHIGNGHFSPYADNLLVFKASQLQNVVFINAPLVFFRTHEGSVSFSSTNINVYSNAQCDLLNRSILLFKDQNLKNNFSENLALLVNWCMSDFCWVLARSRFNNWGYGIKHLFRLRKYISSPNVTETHLKKSNFLAEAAFRLIYNFGKLKTKSLIDLIKQLTQKEIKSRREM